MREWNTIYIPYRSRFRYCSGPSSTGSESVLKESTCCKQLIIMIILVMVAIVIPFAASAQVKEWKFVVLSDTRGDPCSIDGKSGVNSMVLGRIASHVADEKPDLVLVPGDLVLGNAYKCGPAGNFESQLLNWRKAMKPVYDAQIPVLPVRGNHEVISKDYFPDEPCRPVAPNPEALRTWLKIFSRDVPQNGPKGQKGLTYAYPHKNALFIGFDEFENYLSHDQDWLEAMLNREKRLHLFVFGHFPAFEVMHKDNLSCNSAARDNLWRTIGANNGRYYFCGHDHFYDRSEIDDPAGNGIFQVLVGNGGAPFYNYTGGYADKRVKPRKRISGKYGYLVVTVKGPAVSAEMKTLDEEIKTTSDRIGNSDPI